MKKLTIVLFIAAAFIVAGLIFLPRIYQLGNSPSISQDSFTPQERKVKESKNPTPSDWFIRQRAYPQDKINMTAYRQAIDQARRMSAAVPHTDEVVWEEAGPSNIGGRITAISAHPSSPDVVYAGAADGGVLKSADGGDSWHHVFDETGTLSIGAIAVDPNDANTIWVGTGESNTSGDSYPGDGIYRSNNGGSTWDHMGLDYSYYIGRIAIDPSNSDKIFVAACGALFGTNPERGIYRTANGGDTWEQVLFLTDSTAAIDVVINPDNPQIVYAAMWERVRMQTYRDVGGITSGIWRSTDGGDNWTRLTNGFPVSEDVGRIGITLSPSDPDILYAIIADNPGYLMGVWKTTNGGDSWAETGAPSSTWLYSSFGWYFGNIYVHPTNPQEVYALGIYLYRSTNGGSSWSQVGWTMHVDHHAFWISPDNPTLLWDGNDGGVYYSTNGGDNWTKCYDLHITQFYAIDIDYLLPFRLYGGTQDNGTLQTLTGNLDDWEMIYGGDGMYTLVDYTNSDIVFAESQWGNLGKSTNAGQSFGYAINGIEGSDRRNWSTPYAMDPTDPDVLYYGTFRIYKTTDQAEHWDSISEDLTDGEPTGNLTFHTITTIAVAPTNSQVIYVGTDDGNVWISQNGGTTWNPIYQGLPDRWVTRLAVSPQNEAVAYVTLSGFRITEFLPHIFRTTNFGADWVDISGNLPEVPINDVIEDPENPQRLVIGTDAGVYYTENLGDTWQMLGTELPLCSVNDLCFHNPTRSLVAGTHGRSMYKTNLDSLISAPNVSVALTPESTSIQIPANGGTFDYNIAVTNDEPNTMIFDLWIDVTLPDGSTYGPLLGPVEVALGAGIAIDRDRTQAVPANAPVGLYRYNAYTGEYPEVWDSDYFNFTKLSQEFGPGVNVWYNDGESLKSTNISTQSLSFMLVNVFPNPFNATTTISYQLREPGPVELTIFDAAGRTIAELVNKWTVAGFHEVTFDASTLASGIYFYRMKAGTVTDTGKLLLLK